MGIIKDFPNQQEFKVGPLRTPFETITSEHILTGFGRDMERKRL